MKNNLNYAQANQAGSGEWKVITLPAITLGGLLLCATSFAEPFNYARFAWGLLLLWPAAIWLRMLKDSWVRQHAPDKGAKGNNAWLRLPFNALMALAPGLILLWYGLSAPAQPSLTRSGLDVCEFEVGYCVSGTRAAAYFGGFALLIGLAVIATLVHQARQAAGNHDGGERQAPPG